MTHDFKKLTNEIFRLCDKKNKKLAVCESITGGLVISALVSVEGASRFVEEGIVSYSNSSKQSRLGVDTATLSRFGAVSAETAAKMCEGIWREGFVTLSTTGNAGPEALDNKPVGRAYFGVCCGATSVYEFNFLGGRNEIRQQAAATALELLKTALERV